MSNPVTKAIMALVHFVESVFTSRAEAEHELDQAMARRVSPNDPQRRPPKR